MTLLNVCGVSLQYRIIDIELSLEAGQQVHVLGNNGAGKSSLLAVLSGLLSPEKGQIVLHGKALPDYALPELASIRCFQEQHASQVFSMTVKESLQFFANAPLLPAELEHALEINQFMGRDINTLSGGELRRVHIARVMLQIWPAILQGRALLLMDEPIQGLDYRHQHMLMKLLQSVVKKGNLVVITHHDLNLCYRYADRIVMMKDSKLIATGKVQEIMMPQFLEGAFCCKISSYADAQGNRLFQTYLD